MHNKPDGGSLFVRNLFMILKMKKWFFKDFPSSAIESCTKHLIIWHILWQKNGNGGKNCDMIPGNESDVENIDFWVTGLKRWKILTFFIVFKLQGIVHISATKCPIEMEFGSKCSILNGQVVYVEKSKLNIANMQLIPLDRVTNIWKKCINMYKMYDNQDD